MFIDWFIEWFIGKCGFILKLKQINLIKIFKELSICQIF